MNFDIRTPVGLLFLLMGGLLCWFGLTSDPAIYAVSNGLNINLAWGAVMAVFGAVMLLLAFTGRGKAQP